MIWPVVVSAQDSAVAQQFRDWVLVPVGTEGCVLHQRVIAREAGLTLADLTVVTAPAGGARLAIRVPVGASIADPVAYRHPGRQAAVPLQWQSCGTESCVARIEVTPQELDRLRQGRRVTFGFVPVPGAPPLTFDVSLLGLTRGLAAQAACSEG